jgi:integrase
MDKRNLEQRRLGWYAVIEVPPSLRPVLGRKRLRKSLGTRDIQLARLRRHAVVGDLKAIIERARRQAGGGLTDEALEYRKAIAAARDVEQQADVLDALVERAERIEDDDGIEAAKAFYGVGSGRATPLKMHLEEWLAEKRYAERTKSDHRHAVGVLEDWLKADGAVAALETVTGRLASRFKTERLVKAGVHPRTANKLLSGLKSYWTWLERHEHVAVNPWAGKSLPKGNPSSDERERPLTDDEVLRLFAGDPDEETHDVMMLGALTAMRLEELFQLRVADCQGGVFRVRKSKTAAGERLVPIHEDLARLVERRTADKLPGDLVIEGAVATGWDGARSMNFSRRFRRYRERCGVDESEGRRRSRVNFHSFRRWAATKMEQAGHHEHLVARIMGHKVQGMSFGLYSGGALVAQLRAVVESVKLPRGWTGAAATDGLKSDHGPLR